MSEVLIPMISMRFCVEGPALTAGLICAINFCFDLAIRERAGHPHRNRPLHCAGSTSVVGKSSCCLVFEVMDAEIDISDVIQ